MLSNLPTKAKIGNKIYPLNTDYRYGLKCLKISENDDISDKERAFAIIYTLYGCFPNDLEEALKKAGYFLTCGREQKPRDEEPDMDYWFDWERIVASFRSDYGIDLNTAKMHFWEFIFLIEGLTEHCVLSRVREIRGYNLSEFKDPKTKARIQKAQEQLRIPKKRTKEQQKVIDDFFKQLGGENNVDNSSTG